MAYFLIPAEKSLQRYSLSTHAWLAPITFSQTPVVFAVDESGIYVAFGLDLSRFDLDGKNEFKFPQIASTVFDMVVINQYLIVFPISSLWLSLNKQTGSQVDTLSPANPGGTFLALPDKGLIVGQSNSKWISIQLKPDGTFGEQFSRFSDYSLTGDTFMLPEQNRMMAGSGQVFFTNDLSYVKSINVSAGQKVGPFNRIDAVAVFGSQYVVAYKGALIGYDSNDQELGEYTPLQPAQAIFVSGSTIFSFFSRPDGIDVTPLPGSLLGLTGQKKVINPTLISFWPDAVALGSDETLYLLHRPSLSIFRWSVPQRKFLSNITLADPPQDMAFAPLSNRLYLSYPDGKITQIQLAASLQEQPFAATPSHFTGYGLIACDEFVVGVSRENNQFFHYVFDAQGVQVAKKGARTGPHGSWNSANRRLYFQNELSYQVNSEEIDSAGQIKNEINSDNSGYFPPYLWVKPDGSVLVTGDGRRFDAKTLTLDPAGGYPEPLISAAWLGGSLFTVTPGVFGAGLNLGKYENAFQPVSTRHIEGTDAQLFTVAEGLLAVTRQNDHTHITIFGNDLQTTYQSPDQPLFLALIAAPTQTQTQYADDFSNPASGWAVYEDSKVKFGYVNGAYSISTKQPGLYAVFAPTPRAENYEMEVDLADITPSDEYGVILDVMGNADRFILFGFSRLSNRVLAHAYDGSTYRLAYENYAYISKIRIKVIRTRYDLNVENLMSSMYFDLYPYVFRVGFYVKPRPDQPIAKAQFDNFVFRPLEGSVAPAYMPLSTLNARPGSPGAGDFVILSPTALDRASSSTH